MITNLFSYSNIAVSVHLYENENSYNEVHSYARIVYVLSGEVDVHTKGRSFALQPDDLIYINPHEFHDIIGNNAKYLLIHIDYSFFDQSVISNIPYIDCNSLTTKEDNIHNINLIKNIIARLVQLSTFKSDPIKAKSLSYELLSCLNTHFKISDINTTHRDSKTSLIEDILKYCSENYASDLSLQSLADEFHFTAPYMSKLFKQEVGTTFLSYMQDIRLRHVHSDLTRRKIPTEELAEKHGFPNARSLLACFKNKYGISLPEYKKQLTKKRPDLLSFLSANPSSDFGVLFKHLEYTPVVEKDDNKKVIVEIPKVNITKSTISFKHPHAYQIGAGFAKELLDPINQEMIRESVKEIGFKYISFHGILDDDMMVYHEDENGQTHHSFYFVNRVIDFVLSTGAKPIIEISYMPKELAEDPTRTMFIKKSCISLPKDFKKWKDLVKDLLLDLCFHFNKSEVETWPIQIWSIPDSSVSEFGVGILEGYIELYKNTCEAILEVFDNPIIEMPKLMEKTLQDYDIMHKLFDSIDRIYPPKAVNVGFYGVNRNDVPKYYAQTKKNLLLLTSENALDDVIDGIKSTLKNCQKEDMKFLISEWNSSLSHRNLVNDTAYKATYIVRSVIKNHERVDGFGYWTLYDSTETQPPADIFHGGLGLYTRNGVKKSAYYAFRILSMLGKEMIDRGEGYAVFRKDDKIQILLYNYHHINKLYAHGELFGDSLKDRYTAFTESTEIKYLLTLEGFEDGEYQIEESIVDRENSSSFDKWVKIGAPAFINMNQVNDLKRMINLKKNFGKKDIVDSTLLLQHTLAPHEICLIEIVKVK